MTSAPSGGAQSQLALTSPPGDAGSALALASAITATSAKTVDVAAKLQAAHLGDLQWQLIPIQKLWQLLVTDSTAARAESPARTPFLHVDLTEGACLPMWMAPEDIGAKSTGMSAIGYLQQKATRTRPFRP